MRTETTAVLQEDPSFTEPVWHETPSEFLARTGLGVDKGWRAWNEAQRERGNEDAVLSRSRFRAAIRGAEF